MDGAELVVDEDDEVVEVVLDELEDVEVDEEVEEDETVGQGAKTVETGELVTIVATTSDPVTVVTLNNVTSYFGQHGIERSRSDCNDTNLRRGTSNGRGLRR